MIYLWASILSSTLIYLTFKVRATLKANMSGAIIVNYATATILGLILHPESSPIGEIFKSAWFPIAALIGLLFVIMFFLIGWSSEKAGIVLTTIATRMSMILPISFSLFLFDELITFPKILKIIITLIAVALALYHKPDKKIKRIYSFLPVILFIGSGSVDTLVKTAQQLYIPKNEIELFSSSLFGISFIASLILLFIKKSSEKIFAGNTVIVGIALGAFNFGSLYFLINALNNSGISSSLLFGINNLSIVCLSLLFGAILFKEKLSAINWTGIAFSIICIFILINF